MYKKGDFGMNVELHGKLLVVRYYFSQILGILGFSRILGILGFSRILGFVTVQNTS